ncbi:hypothetical protein ES708_27204 [subsurface metagenome]
MPIERNRHKRIMSDYERSLVFYAQKYVVSQLAKKASKEMVGFIWGSKNPDLGPDEYRLTIQKGKKKLVFPFTKDELIEDYGSTKWKTRLLIRVNEIFRRLET